MRQERSIDLGTRTVTVRELTVADIRLSLKDAESIPEGVDGVVDVFLLEDARPSEIARMTDLEAADLADLTPGELRAILDVAREVNADFFAMRARLRSVGMQAPGGPAGIDGAPSNLPSAG